jgi:hypothetical protein
MKPTVWVLLLTALAAGCRVCDNAWRNLVTERSAYCEREDRHVACDHSRALAEAAWAELVSCMPEVAFSQDYAAGFKHGYAGYLYGGGQALPPPLPLPPRKYWNVEYSTPAGQQAARDWLAGARVGIESAQQSGLRELMVVPSSMCGIAASSTPGLIVPGPVEGHPLPPVTPHVPPAPASGATDAAAPAAGTALPARRTDVSLPRLTTSAPSDEAEAAAPRDAKQAARTRLDVVNQARHAESRR